MRLDAVHAAFELELGKHAPAVDRSDRFLVAADFGRARGDELELPSLNLGEAQLKDLASGGQRAVSLDLLVEAIGR